MDGIVAVLMALGVLLVLGELPSPVRRYLRSRRSLEPVAQG
jgi:hypothetical protein